MWGWNFLIFIGSLFALWKMQALLSALDLSLFRSERTLKSLRAVANPGDAQTDLSHEEPQTRVAIEVIEPLELAKSQSVLARMFSGIVPNIVLQQTYARVVAEAKADLKRKGVKANVSIIQL